MKLFSFWIFFLFFLVVGCQSPIKRSDPRLEPHPKNGTTTGQTVTPPSNTAPSPSPVPEPIPGPLNPEMFKNQQKSPQKIGVIIGPGGLKTFAAIGVLQELEKAQLPVDSIVGLEWGSVVAALYSVKARAHDVEWKMMKLKKDELPKERFFRSGVESSSISDLSGFFVTVFENKRIEEGKIAFSCPSYYLNQEKVSLIESGSYKNAATLCLPYPPFYKVPQLIAAPFAIEEAVQFLRKKGSTAIVLINVLGTGTILDEKKIEGSTVAEVLWREIRKNLRAPHAGVDWIVDVPTKGDMMDLDSVRSLIQTGQQTGASVAPQMAQKFGY